MTTERNSRPRVRRWLITVLLSPVLLAMVAYPLRRQILIAFARLWIVDQSGSPADAIAILGGGLETRPFAAIRMFQAGLAHTILVPKNLSSPLERGGFRTPDSETTRRLLETNGIPTDAIQLIGNNVDSTRDELIAIREWMRQHSATRVIVPTDLFHTRRVYWFGNHLLAGQSAELLVAPIPTRKYSITNWWRSEDGVVSFQNEIVKTAFYWAKYW